MAPLSFVAVLRAIQFDNQLLIKADKVDNVFTHRVLSAKPKTFKLFSA